MVCLLVAAAGCGEVPEPAGFPVGEGVSGGGDGSEELGRSDQGTPATTVVERPVATTDFVPRRTDNSVAELLIASNRGVLVGYGPQVEPVGGSLQDVPVSHVVDDLISGLVVQEIGVDGPVKWVSGVEAESNVISEGGAELLDVGYVNGASFAVLYSDSLVELVRLVDGVRTPLVELGAGEELVDASVSGGTIALALANAKCGDLHFYGVDGAQVQVNGPGEPDCIVPHRPTYGAIAMSPDGGSLAYTMVSYRDDLIEVATEVVVRDLSSGEEWFRRKIGEDFDRIMALSFDGERVTYLRESTDASSVTVLELTGRRDETQIDLPDGADVMSVSFARLAVFTNAN